ncbi:MAG: hypothetical protein RIR00_502 [Pseudomonadota bacterium]|jgi:hypothetical protein
MNPVAAENLPCVLCGLPLGAQPFPLTTPQATLQFCCEGCRGIYTLLHELDAGPDPAAGAAASPKEKS